MPYKKAKVLAAVREAVGRVLWLGEKAIVSAWSIDRGAPLDDDRPVRFLTLTTRRLIVLRGNPYTNRPTKLEFSDTCSDVFLAEDGKNKSWRILKIRRPDGSLWRFDIPWTYRAEGDAIAKALTASDNPSGTAVFKKPLRAQHWSDPGSTDTNA